MYYNVVVRLLIVPKLSLQTLLFYWKNDKINIDTIINMSMTRQKYKKDSIILSILEELVPKEHLVRKLEKRKYINNKDIELELIKNNIELVTFAEIYVNVFKLKKI